MPAKHLIPLLLQLTTIAILAFFAKDIADVIVQHAGHKTADLIVTLAVKFTYALLGCSLLIVSIKPLYYWLDKLTPYETNKELDQNNQAAGDFASRIISAVILGSSIIIGLAVD